MPSTASSTIGRRVLDDVHLARPQAERAAGGQLLDLVTEVEPALAVEHPDDLVVEVVVPRRPARRDVAHEERRAGRAVVRAVEELEGARAGRLARLDVLERDDALDVVPSARAGRSPRPGSRGRTKARSRRSSVPSSPAGRSTAARLSMGPSPHAPVPSWTKSNVSCSLVAQLERGAGLEAQVVERELRAPLGRHQRTARDAVGDDWLRAVRVLHAPHAGSIGSEPRAKGSGPCRRPRQ